MIMDNQDGLNLQRKTPDSFIRHSSLAIIPAESSSSKQEKETKEIMNLALQSIFVHTSHVIFCIP
jgi:hypothetical protein